MVVSGFNRTMVQSVKGKEAICVQHCMPLVTMLPVYTFKKVVIVRGGDGNSYTRMVPEYWYN